ncbi:DUF2059 domain-containing protein [Roseovarius sp. LXJ103]|uniref:DUF2059 domain-containing protein n=1 Tax=Roseovarius carneus TaxID=2853164 RepID=UPI000D61794E|nr:DUF2059 domain-containing protein [Roseovarius carneus]MBZ8119180.1 DUF2059 domain-containing protein [Roseovarius carneus]PWE35189.1 hypothetical protein DD563_03935 [Pelagicola sp. LXJ1103]
MMMRILPAVALAFGLLMSGPAPASEERAAQIEALLEALDLEQTVEIMEAEGLRYGAQVLRDFAPDADLDSWNATVARIYDSARMSALVRAEFATGMEGVETAPLTAFFSSDVGARIIALELAARRGFMQDGMEEAAQAALGQAEADKLPILEQIDALISDSDLIERNVMGSLNSNLMFYRGLMDGGASELGEADILADVWSQEGAVRTETEIWLRGFLLIAYQPLSAQDLEAYGALYRSVEGRGLNAALFGAFNQMYEELSYLLGRAVAERMMSAPL